MSAFAFLESIIKSHAPALDTFRVADVVHPFGREDEHYRIVRVNGKRDYDTICVEDGTPTTIINAALVLDSRES